MQTLKEFLRTDRFASCTGVELLEIKPGYARARMLVTERHLNGGGVCQGGALFTLADLAFAAVANSHRRLTLSVTANITFLRPAKSGYVYADAAEVFNHHRIPFVEVKITNEKGGVTGGGFGIIYSKKRACRNAHKLKITLATGSCSEGDFDKKEVLTHLYSGIYYPSFTFAFPICPGSTNKYLYPTRIAVRFNASRRARRTSKAVISCMRPST